MSGRYAIYYVPDPKSDSYRLASKLLGRCVYTGAKLPRPKLKNVNPAELIRHTQRASIYGFHGTIVAPFETTANEADLTAAAAFIAKNIKAFELKCLKLVAVGNTFAAILPEYTPEELKSLEHQYVMELSRFRLPLNEGDIARRGLLSPKHMDNLKQWGYHLVFDEFIFHLTVADSLPAVAGDFLAALESYLAPVLNSSLIFDRLGLFHQPSRTEPFSCQKMFLLQGFENEY